MSELPLLLHAEHDSLVDSVPSSYESEDSEDAEQQPKPQSPVAVTQPQSRHRGLLARHRHDLDCPGGCALSAARGRLICIRTCASKDAVVVEPCGTGGYLAHSQVAPLYRRVQNYRHFWNILAFNVELHYRAEVIYILKGMAPALPATLM